MQPLGKLTTAAIEGCSWRDIATVKGLQRSRPEEVAQINQFSARKISKDEAGGICQGPR